MIENYLEEKPLLFKEYGRNVQKMIDAAILLPTKEERNLAAKEIIRIMANIAHHNGSNGVNKDDLLPKLWLHLLQMSNYKLDVDVPYTLPEHKQPSYVKCYQALPYPNQNASMYKQYGNIVQEMIQKAIETEDEDIKAAQIMVIANVMKLNHKQWSKDHILSDSVIAQHIYEISKGKIDIREQELDMNRFVTKARENERNRKKKKKKKFKNNFKNKNKFKNW
ncbi:MAG: DUF4290 domain-containing protein [Bacteroidia bacterium]|nr:DUF4290 domain-containing protein [Bacteroidia bacterium]